MNEECKKRRLASRYPLTVATVDTLFSDYYSGLLTFIAY